MAHPTDDRELLALLTSTEAASLLQLALTGRPGAKLPSFEHRIERVHHRPGRDTSVRYRVQYAGDDTDASPRIHDRLVLSTGRAAFGAPGVVELRAGDDALAAWRLPADPALPTIAACHDPAVAAAWLADTDADLGSDRDVHVDVLGYRPLRRATIRMRRGTTTRFVKTVHGAAADAMSRRHRLAARSGVMPEVLAEPAPGTLVLREADGITLARAIASSGESAAAADALADTPPVAEPRGFIDLLDRLPIEALELPARPSWTDRLAAHARAAADVHPHLAARIDGVAERIARIVAATDPGAIVPVHGDAGVANIIVRDGEVTMLLDADTLGPGHRVDDLACALAHLAVLPTLARSPAHARAARATLVAWHAAFEAQARPRVDAAGLRARVAAVLLTLVAAARPSHADERLHLAEAWQAAAARALDARERIRSHPDHILEPTPTVRSIA